MITATVYKMLYRLQIKWPIINMRSGLTTACIRSWGIGIHIRTKKSLQTVPVRIGYSVGIIICRAAARFLMLNQRLHYQLHGRLLQVFCSISIASSLIYLFVLYSVEYDRDSIHFLQPFSLYLQLICAVCLVVVISLFVPSVTCRITGDQNLGKSCTIVISDIFMYVKNISALQNFSSIKSTLLKFQAHDDPRTRLSRYWFKPRKILNPWRGTEIPWTK